MKKVLTALLLLIAAAAAVVFIFFPGLPWYIKVDREYSDIGASCAKIPADIPASSEEFEAYTGSGLMFSAWQGMTEELSDKGGASWTASSGSSLTAVSEVLPDGDGFLDNTGLSLKELESFCKSCKKSVPENEYEFDKLLLGISMQDFNIHDRKNSKIFYKLAGIKSSLDVAEGQYYELDGVGFRGLLYVSEAPEGMSSGEIGIYPERDRRSRINISISAADRNELLLVAETIKLTE